MSNKEPQPIVVQPSPVPSDELIREWEHLQSAGLHVVTAGGEPCTCWCGERHEGADVEDTRYYFGIRSSE